MVLAEKSRGIAFRDLLGCGGGRIDWRFPAAFVVANILSNLPEMIRTLASWKSFPVELRLWFLPVQLIAPLVMAAAAVLAFRKVRETWLSIAACAVAYEIVMTLVRLGFSQRIGAIQFVSGTLWVFLFFAGLALGARMISFLPLGLAAGATAAGWLHSALFMLWTALSRPGVRFSFSGELLSFGLTLLSSLIFGFAFWGGLRIAGLSLERPAGALPGAAAAAAGEGDDWLRRALAFHGLSRQLRSSGVGSLLFGAVAILLGATTMGQSPVNGALVLLGLVLIGEGIWIMTSPSTSAIIVDGLVVMVIGIWNIGISAVNIERAAGTSMSGRFLLFGIFQIVWGVGRMVQSRRYADLRGFRLDSVERKRLEDEIASTLQSGPDRGDIVAFESKAIRSGQARLRLLRDHAALFSRGKVDEVIPRSEVGCEPPPQSAGDPLQATLRLGKRRLGVKISREAYERLGRWSGRVPESGEHE